MPKHNFTSIDDAARYLELAADALAHYASDTAAKASPAELQNFLSELALADITPDTTSQTYTRLPDGYFDFYPDEWGGADWLKQARKLQNQHIHKSAHRD